MFLSFMSLNFQVGFLQECHLKDTEDIRRFNKEWTAGPSAWRVGNVYADGNHFQGVRMVYIKYLLYLGE